MKIIEAMKQIKDLQRKIEDLKGKIKQCSADYDIETPLYVDQFGVVQGWVQSISDMCKEILRLRVAIQKTNLATSVAVDLGGNTITKTIAEWIHRRRDLANLELSAYSALTDRGLNSLTSFTQSTGENKPVKLRRYYDPAARGKAIDVLKSEPVLIDAKLEVANAITDLIE